MERSLARVGRNRELGAPRPRQDLGRAQYPLRHRPAHGADVVEVVLVGPRHVSRGPHAPRHQPTHDDDDPGGDAPAAPPATPPRRCPVAVGGARPAVEIRHHQSDPRQHDRQARRRARRRIERRQDPDQHGLDGQPRHPPRAHGLQRGRRRPGASHQTQSRSPQEQRRQRVEPHLARRPQPGERRQRGQRRRHPPCPGWRHTPPKRLRTRNRRLRMPSRHFSSFTSPTRGW